MGSVRVRLRRLAVVGVLVAMTPPARAATFTVNSTADQVDAIPGDGVCASAANLCTLRAAVLEANALPGGDTVTLPPGIFRLSLTGADEDVAATGDLDVTDALEVTGAEIDATVLDGYGADRIFDVLGASPFGLANLTLRRGRASGADGGGVRHAGPAPLTLTTVRLARNFASAGAAVHHGGGGLAVTGCVFEENLAGSGGAIYKTGPGALAVSESVFLSNVASGGSGGAIAFEGPETVAIAGSRFVATSGGGGGAVSIDGAAGVAISSSQFEDSQSYGNGGAVSYSGPGATTVSGTTFTGGLAGGSGGALFVDADGSLDVTGSTFSENAAGYAGGAIYYTSNAGGLTLRDGALTANAALGAAGGAFYASAAGPLTLADLEVRGNSSVGGGGGGVAAYHESAAISGVRFLDNLTASDAGGGLQENAAGDSTITDSTFAGNRVDDGDGGGLARVGGGVLTVERALFAGNVAGAADAEGGGLYAAAGEESLIFNVTFSGNHSAYRGGGLFGATTVRVRSTTFAGNVASQGGAAYNDAELRLGNTILAAGAAGANCAGTPPVSGSGNIDTDGSCRLAGAADRAGVDPELDPLADNGGPTATHALAPTSPAIDAGNSAICPATDQRGIPRPADGNADGRADCDVGAYEHVDLCPNDPRKIIPGACGCGEPDADDNANGVVDCLVNAELGARLARARTLLAELVEDKSPAERARRGELRTLATGLVAYVARHRQGIELADPGANPAKLVRRLGRALKAAARARRGRLERARQRAGTALGQLEQALASR
jgi:CSLREA domain-containing protein